MTNQRTEIKDLPREDKELSNSEAQNILGGRIRPVVGGGTTTGLADDLTQDPNNLTASESDQSKD